VWLFVDALDECGKQNAVALVKVFQSLLESFESQPAGPRQFRICFSCRHYPILSLHRADDTVFEIYVEDENASDISTFVDGQLAKFRARTPSTLPTLITERASGVFMWARLVVERILDLELEGSGLAKMEAAVRSTPPDLDNLYRQLIQDMEPASFRLVEWICFAERPLLIDQLRWAMVIEADHPYKHQSLHGYRSSEEYVPDDDMMKRRVQTLSRGLAEVTPSTLAVQFIHQSVEDFFKDKGLLALGGCGTPTGAAIDAHFRLSKICTRYLSMDEIRLAPTYRKRNLPDFFDYATNFWVTHAKQCDAESAQDDLLTLLGWPSEPDVFTQLWVPVDNRLTFGLSGAQERATLAHIVSQYGLTQLLTTMLGNMEGATACIDAKDNCGQTPLSHASEQGHTAVVKLLLGTGKVDVDTKDRSGRTPLFMAATGGQAAVIKLLLDTGKVDVDTKDIRGSTALSNAAHGGHAAVVKLLLGTGKVDVDTKDIWGSTALSNAVHGGHAAVVKLLLGTGKVDVDIKDVWGCTPLMLAAEDGHTAVVKLLLDTGKVDVDTKDVWGCTPLMLAAEDGHTAVVKLLLDTGKADCHCKDEDDETALSWAIRRGHEAVVKLLEAAK
jgi:ankyrin repeat protein